MTPSKQPRPALRVLRGPRSRAGSWRRREPPSSPRQLGGNADDLVLQRITDFLPLTYLADALRKITNDGAGVADISQDLLGLTVWAVIAFLIALRLFKWE